MQDFWYNFFLLCSPLNDLNWCICVSEEELSRFIYINFFQNHVAMGRSIAILKDILENNINPMEIEKAYLHYEAMTERKYEFNCSCSLWILSIHHDMGYLSKGIIHAYR